MNIPLSSVAMLEEGSNVKVKCAPKGSKVSQGGLSREGRSSQVHWMKNGRRINTWRHHHNGSPSLYFFFSTHLLPGNGAAWMAENGNLRISNLSGNDGGVYSCISHNEILGNVTIRMKDNKVS